MVSQAFWILNNGEVLLSRNGVGDHGHIVLWNYEKFNFSKDDVTKYWEEFRQKYFFYEGKYPDVEFEYDKVKDFSYKDLNKYFGAMHFLKHAGEQAGNVNARIVNDIYYYFCYNGKVGEKILLNYLLDNSEKLKDKYISIYDDQTQRECKELSFKEAIKFLS